MFHDYGRLYLDEIPYNLKCNEIDRVMTWLFTGMAAIGIIVQFLKLGIFYDLPERTYAIATYSLVLLVLGIFVMAVAAYRRSQRSALGSLKDIR